MKRAVFLDRDGVLNAPELRDGKARAPLTLEAFRPYRWAADAVSSLREGGFVCVVVTNQPEVATGELAPATLDAMHRRLRDEVGVDGVYVCPHRDEDDCRCRKPRPGLLLQAAGEWGVDLAASFMVGDRRRDVDAGRAAGCLTVLVESAATEPDAGMPDYRARDVQAAAATILSLRGGA